MITYSKLGQMGRLGNQLFQIASTIGIAAELGEAVSFPHWDYEPFFRLPEVIFRRGDDGETVIQSDVTDLVEHMNPAARPYLQDYNLFSQIHHHIWSWLQPSDRAMETLIHLPQYADFVGLKTGGLPTLSVHVRRGDNVIDPGTPDKWRYHPPRPTSYYLEEIEKLDETHNVVVFSDDIPWCRDNIPADLYWDASRPRLKEHQAGYKENPFDDWVDLHMMSFCDAHIISNSTYAFWGAFLSLDPAPVFPWPFFGIALDYIDCSLMFPPNWVRHDHGPVLG